MGSEIAPHFDMHVDTFYNKVAAKYNMGFTEYCSLKRSHGDSLLREKQFEKALEKDNTMLIWLGKVRLNQKEDQTIIVTKEYKESVDAVVSQLNAAQEAKKQEQN